MSTTVRHKAAHRPRRRIHGELFFTLNLLKEEDGTFPEPPANSVTKNYR
jgi:hypothetical protein